MGAKLLKKAQLVPLFGIFFVLLWRQLVKQPMLYLELQPDAMHFFSLEEGQLKHTLYHMQPTHTFESNLQNALSSMPQTSGHIEAMRVIVCNAGTAMSLNDFSEEVAPDVFSYCFPNRTKENIMYQMIPESNAVWVFGLPQEQCKTLEKKFGTVYYASTMAPLARYLLHQTRAGERKILVNCRRGWADIIAVKGRYLEIANCYQVNGPTDVAYYTTAIVKRIGFNQSKDECLLIGGESQRNAVHTELTRFISHLEHCPDITQELLGYLH